jgi:hypothetical protein
MVLLLFGVTMQQSFASGYQLFEEKGKVGIMDDTGHVVLPPSFEALGWSDGNFSVVGEVTGYRLSGFWGIINLSKRFITPAAYESLVYCGGDCIVARKKINLVSVKAGCINLRGEIKIPFMYDGILIQGLRAVVFNLKGPHYYYGLVDINNRALIPVEFKNVRPLGTLRFAVENLAGKIALYGDEGNRVTDFSIDSVSSFYKGFAIIYQDHLQGLIDRDGAVRFEAKYSSIRIGDSGRVFTQLPNEWLLINEKNETVKRIFADDLTPLDEKRLVIGKGNVFGLTDSDLNPLVPVQFDGLLEIEPGKYFAKRNAKWGVIDEQGGNLIPCSFDSLVRERESYCAYRKNLGWQLIDTDGKELTDKYYDGLALDGQGGFRCVRKGFSGMINAEGREYIHCVFDSITTPVDGLVAVKFKGNYGIISSNEDWAVAPQPFPLTVINKQRYLQRQPTNNFVKSFTGEILYFTPYRLVFYPENFVEFLPDGTEKTISYNGETMHRVPRPENVSEIFPESEGFRGIKKDGRYGFMDQRGRLRIANRYDSIGEFHEGLAAIKLIGKWGFVNPDDQIAVNPNYDNCSFFQNGLAIVSRNKKYGLIWRDGRTALQLRYDRIRRLPDQKFLLVSSSLLGLADETGNMVVEPRFNQLREAGNNLLVACRDGKCGVITDQGLSVIPMIYDCINPFHPQRIFLAEKKSAWKSIEIK